MVPPSAQFDLRSAQRIIRAARSVERGGRTSVGEPTPRILAGAGGGAAVSVLRIADVRTRGECYKAYIRTAIDGPFTVNSGSSGFTAANIGSDGEEVTALNTQQGDSATTHALTAATQKLKLVLGLDLGFVDDAGKKCFLIVGKDFKSCSGAI
jgi:hypothetical protein